MHRLFVFIASFLFSVSALAQIQYHDFELIKSWFIDSKNEVQLQLESPRTNLGMIVNYDFSDAGKVGTNYFLYSLSNPHGPAPANTYLESVLRDAVVAAVVHRRESVETNIFYRTRSYSNGQDVLLMPNPLMVSYPIYVPMEKVDDESRPKDIYYELLVKRLNSLRIVTSRHCTVLFAR